MDWFDYLIKVITFGIPFFMGFFIAQGIFSPPKSFSCSAMDCFNNHCNECSIFKDNKFPSINNQGKCDYYKQS